MAASFIMPRLQNWFLFITRPLLQILSIEGMVYPQGQIDNKLQFNAPACINYPTQI